MSADRRARMCAGDDGSCKILMRGVKAGETGRKIGERTLARGTSWRKTGITICHVCPLMALFSGLGDIRNECFIDNTVFTIRSHYAILNAMNLCSKAINVMECPPDNE